MLFLFSSPAATGPHWKYWILCFSPLQVKAAIKHALSVGYRHIDCAAIYGNEAEIGEALKESVGPGKVRAWGCRPGVGVGLGSFGLGLPQDLLPFSSFPRGNGVRLGPLGLILGPASCSRQWPGRKYLWHPSCGTPSTAQRMWSLPFGRHWLTSSWSIWIYTWYTGLMLLSKPVYSSGYTSRVKSWGVVAWFWC